MMGDITQVSNYLSFSKEDTDEQKKQELEGVVNVGEQIWVKVRARAGVCREWGPTHSLLTAPV